MTKMSDPDAQYWECEMDDADFNFIIGGRKDDSIMFENVRVFRKGKRDEVLAREGRNEEELVADEAEESRLKRAAKEAQPGQLRRPEINPSEYHPYKK